MVKFIVHGNSSKKMACCEKDEVSVLYCIKFHE